MHGLIFTAFRQFTQREWPEAQERILADAPIVVVTSVYDDADFATTTSR